VDRLVRLDVVVGRWPPANPPDIPSLAELNTQRSILARVGPTTPTRATRVRNDGRHQRPTRAVTIATMPDLIDSGNPGQAATTAAGGCPSESGRGFLGSIGAPPRVVHSPAARTIAATRAARGDRRERFPLSSPADKAAWMRATRIRVDSTRWWVGG